jgi:hypothetical protein
VPTYSGWGEVPWSEGTWGLDLEYYQVTGVAGTGAVGTCNFLVITVPVGVQGVAEVGGFQVLVDDVVVPDTIALQGVGAVGTPFIYIFKQVSVTGVSATGAVNDAAFAVDKTPIGVEGTGAVENITIRVDDVIPMPSVAGTATVGDVVAKWIYDRTVYLDGWGSINWGGGGWGNGSISVQASGDIGSVAFKIDDAFQVTGVEATGAVGTVSVFVGDAVIPDGVQGTGQVGTLAFQVSITSGSVEGTGAIATGVFVADVIPDGVEGTGAVGTVIPQYDETVIPTGVEGTGAVTTIAVVTTVTLTGVSGTGAIGTVELEIDDSKLLPGVAGTGAVGTILFRGWTQINDFQDPNWVPIDVAA